MSPIRQLREQIAAALKPLQIEVHDVLPDQVNPPAVAVGLPSIGPSQSSATVQVFTTRVTLVGERADFHDSQIRLDDLYWDVWTILRDLPNVWLLPTDTGSVDVAGQNYPGAVFTLESQVPC